MNIAIFGTNKEALYLAKEINGFVNIVFFIDNDIKKQGLILEGKEVISFKRFLKFFHEVDRVIIAVRGIYSRQIILYQLYEVGIRNIGILKLSYYDYEKRIDIDDFGNAVDWLEKTNKYILPYVEINVIKNCNLNCKGCSHFANLFDKKTVYDIEEYKKDITELSEKFHVVQLRLMGGEPLLVENIHEYIEFTRKIFPEADICVVTNGILLNENKKELLKCMRKNDVGFSISPYKPTIAMKKEIETIMSFYKVKYSFIGKEIKEFAKNLTFNKHNNATIAQKFCYSSGCCTLEKGKLYKCPFEAFLNYFFQYFKLTDRINGGISIYDNSMRWDIKLKELLKCSVEACKYCTFPSKNFSWEVSNNPHMEDWIVNE